MNQNEFEAMECITPLLNTSTRKRQANIAVTTSSARHDLTLRLRGLTQGHYYDFMADGGDVALALNNSDAGTVDRTTTSSGATECHVIPNGQTRSWKFVDNYTWLVVQGSAACILRIALSSRAPGQNVGDRAADI